ncbi:MAG TPA: EpsI family protein [Vicinamibacterales bacterium]
MTQHSSGPAARLSLLAGAFCATAAILGSARVDADVPLREPLRSFPIRVAAWHGWATADLKAQEARILGADEYLTRVYSQAATEPVALFIAYYGSQRTGAVIHSPLNCLPGAGWQPVDRQRTVVDVDTAAPDAPSPRARRIEINRVLIQKGEERQLAFYWYHERGRVIASEYASRVYLMLDAARYGRTDGALVRVLTPVGADPADIDGGTSRLVSFVQAIFPDLTRYLPS